MFFYIRNLNNKHIVLGNLYNTLLRGVHYFTGKKCVRCNICGWEGYKFYAMISYHSIRYNAVCPQCYSKERHRRFILYLESTAVLRKGLSYLDIGPVKRLRNYIEGKECFYFSVDIASPLAMSKMDLTHLGIHNNRFDLIVCYHVLEHVRNDLMAIGELYRVLRPGGKCFIQVPLNKDESNTIEYREPDPKDCDHLRSYGRDIIARIASKGFIVKEENMTYDDNGKNSKLALGKAGEPFFICQKAETGP